MNSKDFKAMISLLDDSDSEVVGMIEDKIRLLGLEAIPMLEQEWVFHTENPKILNKIESLRSDLRLGSLVFDFKEWASHGGEDLLRGLWLVARLAEPNLKIEDLRGEVNKIYMEVWVKSSPEMHPVDILKLVNDVVFNQFNYEPNVKNFHSVKNSLFNEVLKLRTGNPVALSCLYILLAEKLDIPLYGVNLPNLFITIFDLQGSQFYVNPFNKGQFFQRRDIDEYLIQMKLEPKKEYFQACSNVEIIRRVLTNLAYAYKKAGDEANADLVSQVYDIVSPY